MRPALFTPCLPILLGALGLGCGTSPTDLPIGGGTTGTTTGPAGATAPAGTTGGAGTVPAADGCVAGTLGPGETTETLMHDGVTRNYLIHVPAGYAGKTPVPLVLDIHGLTSNAAEQAAISGWRAKSDATGFVVIWPNGLDNSWNGGSLCCGPSLANHVDDEGFLRAVVAKTRAEGCIDATRVYATGLSDGGAMAHLLACRAADVFAATAPVSMGNGTVPCAPSRPIALIEYRGTLDLLVPYNGGFFPSAADDFAQWQLLDGCAAPAQMTNDVCQTVSGCQADVEVTLCSIVSGHVLYADAVTQGAAVPDVAWAAFARHTLP